MSLQLSPHLGCMRLHLPPTCLPHLSRTLVSHSGFLGPHEFTLVSPFLPHLSLTLGALGRMSLHLSPPCLPLWVLGRMSLHLSPLVSHSGCLGPHEFTLVFPLVPHLSPTLVSHSGFLGPHELTLVSPLSPTLGSLSPTLGALCRMNLHLSPTCLPHLSPNLGSLGRMSLHLSPTFVSHPCLPLWVPWAA